MNTSETPNSNISLHSIRLKEIEVKKEDMRNEANTAKQQMKIEFEELVEKIRDENSRLRQDKESLQSK